jgi:hypothetical protein
MGSELILTGLDGGNPLAFLAALGTLRALSLAWPDRGVRMSWRKVGGAWRPVLHGESLRMPDALSALMDQCGLARRHPTLGLADDLTIPALDYREHLLHLISLHDREATAYAAAFGSEAHSDDKGNIDDTSLRTMSGAGHQHFLKTMRDILAGIRPDQLEEAMIGPWRYADPLKGLSLRFDPLDEKRYALRWDDPSGDPTRNTQGNMLGANALAILAIPLFRVAPVAGALHTTGFRGLLSKDCRWTWPIWNGPLDVLVVGSLLALADIQEPEPRRGDLSSRGIVEVYRSQRITIGKFRNFTPAQPV